ncbi:MAG TPA: WhiB family transcriptional regulator [Streptosporangiaceae bacterium]|nr:WhiB family transcriptional regulator [Streptosporangiaceae bacterium]HEV2450379.1 WhiB family transcriptional regulator [Streptosporangiaceae bacterium]
MLVHRVFIANDETMSSGASLAQVAEAKAICAGCQVRRDCLAFALRTHQVHGVWGGLSERERYPLWSATLTGARGQTAGVDTVHAALTGGDEG